MATPPPMRSDAKSIPSRSAPAWLPPNAPSSIVNTLRSLRRLIEYDHRVVPLALDLGAMRGAWLSGEAARASWTQNRPAADIAPQKFVCAWPIGAGGRASTRDPGVVRM